MSKPDKLSDNPTTDSDLASGVIRHTIASRRNQSSIAIARLTGF